MTRRRGRGTAGEDDTQDRRGRGAAGAGGAGLLRRIPIRIRLAAAFAAFVALALVVVGLIVYERTSSSLTDRIDDELRTQVLDVGRRIGGPFGRGFGGRPGPPGGPLGPARAVQLVDAEGRVLSGTAGLAEGPLAPPDDVRRAVEGGRSRVVETSGAATGGERVRVLIAPLPAGAGAGAIVAAASVGDRDAALSRLRRELILGGLAALVLAALAGYWVTARALRPVEEMRARAASISERTPEGRLPLPDARDEIHRLGETLNDMLGRLQGALANERALVADAAHELRTPIAILKGELELATSRPRSREELERTVASASEEADRLAQLVEDLLVIARSDQGRLPVRPREAEADEILASVARRFGSRAVAATRRLEVAGTTGLRVWADPDRAGQGLGNLVENALRHGHGPIELSAEAAEGGVRLHVRDRGPGFPPGFLPRAFERFSRADEGRTGGGAGLGLSIVAAIAEASGGRAGAANRPGGGADVWIELPEAPDPPGGTPAPR